MPLKQDEVFLKKQSEHSYNKLTKFVNIKCALQNLKTKWLKHLSWSRKGNIFTANLFEVLKKPAPRLYLECLGPWLSQGRGPQGYNSFWDPWISPASLYFKKYFAFWCNYRLWSSRVSRGVAGCLSGLTHTLSVFFFLLHTLMIQKYWFVNE